MPTNQNPRRWRRLSAEILGLLGISLVISFCWFYLLSGLGIMIAEAYFQAKNIVLTDLQLMQLDDWVFNLSLLVAVGFFLLLFLFLLGERLTYIREILRGIHALRNGQMDYVVPIEGANELTQLAEAVNYLSESQYQVQKKERQLQKEKDQLIRNLSHDIRTPLTAILSYSEMLLDTEPDGSERKRKLERIHEKAEQIRELTDVLLDGGRRNLEWFDDAHLLMEQLALDFHERLEEQYDVVMDLSRCAGFRAKFDVQELRRIFDNLITNIQKYADPDHAVTLVLTAKNGTFAIRQSNGIRPEEEINAVQESYGIGLNSIRRIAHCYNGSVEVVHHGRTFEITIVLSVL